jgi:polysaccharide export outer membrane protein
MRIHRLGPDGKMHEIEPKMDDEVRNGDVVYVRESIF